MTTGLAEAFFEAARSNGRFDEAVLRNATFVSSSHGSFVCEVPVTLALCNRYGTLHGGAAATLVDVCTTAALLTQAAEGERTPVSGVTVSLNVIYLRGAELGDTVVVESEVLKLGRGIATLACKLRSKRSGEVCSTGSHVKFLLGALGGKDVRGFSSSPEAVRIASKL